VNTLHDELTADPGFRRMLAIESLALEAAETIATLMAKRKTSRADLAKRLGKSRAWVTQMLSGKANLTIRTLAEVAHALDAGIALKAAAYPAKPARQEHAVPATPAAPALNRRTAPRRPLQLSPAAAASQSSVRSSRRPS